MTPPTEAASDPLTPASALALLAASPEAAVRGLVAANPATPADTLRKLASSFPDEVLGNPALPLHLLEDPAFFARLDVSTCQSLLGSPHATEELSTQLIQHPLLLVRSLVARAPRTSLALLEQLAHSSDLSLVGSVTVNPRLPLAALHALLLHPHEQVVLNVLSTGRVASDWLALLADKHPRIRALLAAKTEDVALLGRLSRDPEYEVRNAVIHNKHTPGSVTRRMRRDPIEGLRREVVGHPSTGRFTRITLLRDPTYPVRKAARTTLQALWRRA